jgi:hypothetical protein
MRNITITVDEEVARWARVWAAQHDTSVSRLVGKLLRAKMRDEQAYDAAMVQYLGQEPVRLRETGDYPSRDELHER